ncbi:MAG: DUF6705 family protein [Ferruginibacter sp.]
MKPTVLFMAFVISFQLSKAQQYDPPVGTNVYNTDLNKFIGQWRYTTTTDTITFILKKEHVTLQNSGGMDFIIGYHLYKKGNDTIISSIQYQSLGVSSGYSTITGLETFGSGSKKLRIILSDVLKNKTEKIELALLDSANTQMQFTRLNIAGGVRLTNAPILSGFTLPDSFVLTKIPMQVE